MNLLTQGNQEVVILAYFEHLKKNPNPFHNEQLQLLMEALRDETGNLSKNLTPEAVQKILQESGKFKE